MTKSSGCKYCGHSPELFEIAVHIADFETSELYLMRNQAYPGRCILVFKNHRAELFELSPEELRSYSSELARSAAAIKTVFGAAKINYAAYGDLVPHLHFHLVPKFPGGRSWGAPFDLDPSPGLFPEAGELAKSIGDIRSALGPEKLG